MTITVLCVSNERENPSLLQSLDDPQIDPIGAISATDALKRLRDESIGCLVSDASLPDLELPHFLDMVSEHHPDLPIILIDDQSDVTRSIDRGVTVVRDRNEASARVLEIIGKNRAREALADHDVLKNAVIDIVHQALVDRTDTDPESLIYNRLVTTNLYHFLWIGTYDADSRQLELHHPGTAIVDQSDLASIIGTGETAFIDEAIEHGTVEKNHGRIETRSASAAVSASAQSDPTRSLTTLAVPLGSEGTAHTVLLLSSYDDRPIDESERVLLGKLRDVITSIKQVSSPRTGEPVTVDTAADFDEFAAKLVHELRNPLGVATAHLEIGREDADPDALAEVDRALQQINYTIDKLSTMARSDDISNVTTHELDSTVTTAWDQIQTANAELAVEDSMPITADHDLLTHLFSNLFRNAVRHAGEDVTVRVGSIDTTGFFVEDDGPGIPAGDRENVFSHGFSTDSGLGIGLSIVQDITDAHGWSVSVTEGEEGGARFEFLLDGRGA